MSTSHFFSRIKRAGCTFQWQEAPCPILLSFLSVPVQIARDNENKIEVIRFRQNVTDMSVISAPRVPCDCYCLCTAAENRVAIFARAQELTRNKRPELLSPDHHRRSCIDKNSFWKWCADHYSISVTLMGLLLQARRCSAEEWSYFTIRSFMQGAAIMPRVSESLDLSNYTI